MEVNKDEAIRCISIAEEAMVVGNFDKAERFLLKAEKLYSTAYAKKMLEELQSNKKNSHSSEARRRTNIPNENSEGHRNSESKSTSGNNKEYTHEQLTQIQRIQKCKDYYEILNVTKEATETEIKKSYKKLALQLHPDKNKAPGASEAFKAVGNAFAILTDSEKRKQYDSCSNRDERMNFHKHQHSHYQEYTRGFEADMTAEELFNMFFGSGFSTHQSNIFMRRNNRWHRSNNEEENTQGQNNGAAVFIQLLPILLLIVLSMLSSFFISDPVYSLQPNSKYPVLRHTEKLNIPYYVKENFRMDYQGSLTRLEANIEDEYIGLLRHNCYREKNQKEAMIWRARSIGDPDLLTRAKKIGTPSCDEFLRFHRI